MHALQYDSYGGGAAALKVNYIKISMFITILFLFNTDPLFYQ